MLRPNYIADPERPCYCGEPCEETGKRWDPSVLCSVCKPHAQHGHCDEGHCQDAAGKCECDFVCHECNDLGTTESDEGAPHACSECTKGATLDYQGERDYGRVPFRFGTLTEYLDRQVSAYGRVDNRTVA